VKVLTPGCSREGGILKVAEEGEKEWFLRYWGASDVQKAIAYVEGLGGRHATDNNDAEWAPKEGWLLK